MQEIYWADRAVTITRRKPNSPVPNGMGLRRAFEHPGDLCYLSSMSEVDHVKCVLGVREKVIENCWHYIYDNFHKFNDANKIKIALAISTKNIPQKVEGMNPQQVVIMGEIKRPDGSPLRYNLGSRDTSQVTESAAEAVSSN